MAPNVSATMQTSRIRFEHVSKRFIVYPEKRRSFQESFIGLFRRSAAGHEFWPLRDVSLEINRGDFVGVIGRNGAGKSTLLKLISRIIEPTSGHIEVNGRLASLLELGAGFHPELTGRENIHLNGSVYGLSRRQLRERIDSIIEFSELREFIDVPLKHYSSGMYVRLGFAVAVHTDPDILLVDEVLAVGDAEFQSKCLSRIQDFRASGGTLVLVSHDLSTIQNLCSCALWLEDGLIQEIGHPTDVAMRYLHQSARDREGGRLVGTTDGRHGGLGGVQIRAVRFIGPEGEPRGEFQSGEPVEVRIYYRADGPVPDPVFGLAIHDQNGVHITGPNTAFAGLRIPMIQDEGWISYRIPALPLLEGTYLISAAVHNRADTVMYDYVDRTFPLRVTRGAARVQYGLVTLQGEWLTGDRIPVVAGSTDSLQGAVAR